MKIYVSVDMEGISGIVLEEQLTPGQQLYQEARQLLTNEVNVIVEALFNEGVTEIIVKDAHGTGFNFLVDQLHPGATYCMGPLKMNQRFPGLDDNFDGAMLVGYHARGGKAYAMADHTMTSKAWQYVMLNGNHIGEIGIDSLLFGIHNVPVILVTGDDKTCHEARHELGPVVTYETKHAYARHGGLLKPPKKVYKDLQSPIRKALKKRSTFKPYQLAGPYELLIRFKNTSIADARHYDGINSIRKNGLEAIYKDDDLVRLLNKSM